MNFLVVGPGAMGCLFAARLTLGGNNVALLDYKPERAKRISESGIRVTGVLGEYTVNVPTVTENIPFTPDFALIFVKANNTKKAGEEIIPFVGPETLIITLQNGLGNIEILEELFRNGNVLGGVTAQGSTLLEEGEIRHAGQGDTVISSMGDKKDAPKKLVSIFNKSGIETNLKDNVQDLIWGKLIVNVGINALTAITRLKNGKIPSIKGTRGIMKEAVIEAAKIAYAKGINLPYRDPVQNVIKVAEATGENVSSMLQDVLKGKTTEVDMINGAIVKEAEKLGFSAPYNKTLTELVYAIQGTYKERLSPG